MHEHVSFWHDTSSFLRRPPKNATNFTNNLQGRREKTKMKIIVTDLEKCVGCHSCELACAVSRSKSGNLAMAILEHPRPAARVRVMGIATQPVPLQCQQCEDAPCASVCPTKALHRLASDQPVLFKRETCIGCSSCVLVCPFGVIRRVDGGIMAKCDLCWDRLADGRQPACVEACPTGSRRLVEANAIAEDRLLRTAVVLARFEEREARQQRSL
jgi:carbon-monoxide dehydrogenase iron sulfur subunit